MLIHFIDSAIRRKQTIAEKEQATTAGGGIMTIEEMCKLKREYGLSYEQISGETGIPVSTVSKMLTGFTKTPRRDTVASLTAYFSGLRRKEYTAEVPAVGYVTEASAVYSTDNTGSRLGGMTIGQREALPDYRRTELIDGILYDMASPSLRHQMICNLVTRQLNHCIESAGRDCVAFDNDIDIVLSEDPATVLVPDILVLCRDDMKQNREIGKDPGKFYGAPALVMEVLSPATKRRDLGAKYAKYLQSGVREYWIIDPVHEKILVYDLDSMNNENNQAELYYLYTFDEKVPVLVSGGHCEVDFPAVKDKLNLFLGRN